MRGDEPSTNTFLLSGREAFILALILVLAALALSVATLLSKPEIAITSFSPIPYKIPINTASILEIESLPGVGKVIAAKIVYYRSNVAQIDSVESLANAAGISLKSAQALAMYVSFGAAEGHKVD